MAELTSAMKSLQTALERADFEPPPDEALSEAILCSTRAIEAVDKYESSIDKSHDDNLSTYRSQLDDMLGKLSRLEDSYLDDVARLVDALDAEPLICNQNSNSTICPSDLGPIPENPTLEKVSAIQPHQSQLKEKLQAYNFVPSHIKGKENFIADALSRAPHRDPIPN